MPDIHGNITAGDLAQGLVQSYHLRNESVTTGKIPDLAVTYPDKIDDPFWNYGDYATLFHNPTVTTTFTSFGSMTIDVPSWVDALTVNAWGNFQLSNSSGSTVAARARIEIEESSEGAYRSDVANNETGIVPIHRTNHLIGVAGSTITVDMKVSVSSGTNTTNFGTMLVQAIGTR